MLWRMYSNLSLYVILSQCSTDHPIWTLLLRHFLLNHSSFMLDLWNYSLYISHSVTTFSVSSYCWVHSRVLDFPVAQMVKNLPANAGDLGLIPELGTFPMSRLLALGGQSIGASASYSFQWIFRLIFFRIDRFDLLAVQGTLKSLLWHYNLKASILWSSAIFMVQFSHLYTITREEA